MILRFALRVILFLMPLLLSQHISAQKFTGKLILGFNGAQIDGDGMSGYHKAGLAAGAAVLFPISEQWMIGPEILYSMKGSQTSAEQLEKGYDRIRYKLNYIDMPLVATCKIKPGFSALVGLQASYLLRAELDAGFQSQGYQNVDPLFKKMDFGFMAGLEYEVFDNVWINGRFCYSVVSTNAVGLTNPNFAVWGAQTRGGFYNNCLQMSLRFRLFGGDDDTKSQGSNTGTSNQ